MPNPSVATCGALNQFLSANADNPSVAPLQAQLARLMSLPTEHDALDGLIGLYKDTIPLIENAIHASDFDAEVIQLYQRIFRELEALIASRGNDDRHGFVVVIPVADRPLHLQACLDSLRDQCRAFGYGGLHDGYYRKLRIVIADDSKAPENIERNREIAHCFDDPGLEVIYFGQDEQLALLERLPGHLWTELSAILGDIDRDAFFHKGPSVMRNIVYLKLREMTRADERWLYYFIDSDQEFKVKVNGRDGDRDVLLANYFYWLDEIFSASDISVVTGKVVGDPPVSPAVMTGTFLDDVIGFLRQMAVVQHEAECSFHRHRSPPDTGAAYHDMADLFGFAQESRVFEYRCTLEGRHDHASCLSDFAQKLSRFFDGVHPTRITYYDSKRDGVSVQPARTVYTGNYVLRYDALRYFIPFAALRLRMAGPVLGRIIRAEIGKGFVSANLPMLHKRTTSQTGQAEFRPGIQRSEQSVDLSGEFERQFFGDVMLFSIDALTGMGYPAADIPESVVAQVFYDTEQRMLGLYAEKHAALLEKLDALKQLLQRVQWWQTCVETENALAQFIAFIRNIEANFGEDARCYRRLASTKEREKRRTLMLAEVLQYARARRVWERALSAI